MSSWGKDQDVLGEGDVEKKETEKEG